MPRPPVDLQRPVNVRRMRKGEAVSPDDFIVMLLGATGTGKSSIIEKLASNELGISQGSSLSTDSKLRAYVLIDPTNNQRVILLDTPGMADVKTTEARVVDRLDAWLKTHTKSWTLDDLSRHSVRALVLHSIHINRFNRSQTVGVNTIKSLSGYALAPCMTIATTLWNQLAESKDSVDRANNRHGSWSTRVWAPEIQTGAKILKYYNTFESAAALLKEITRIPEVKRPTNATSTITGVPQVGEPEDATAIITGVPEVQEPAGAAIHKAIINGEDYITNTKLGHVLITSLQERATNFEQMDAALKADLANKETKKNKELNEALRAQKKENDVAMRAAKADLKTLRKSSEPKVTCVC